jgi:4,5-dihydroxyphthalate decarboxylase
MAQQKLKTVFQTLGHTQALKDGSVKPQSFEFEFEEVPAIIQAFRRMVRGAEFDISEMAMTTYMCARAAGKRITALPIFLVRAFHHGAILHNTTVGLHGPKDLEGKQVAVNRGYTVTTGVWARGVLQHEYGVDLSKINWILSGDEHVAEYKAPANVQPVEKGRSLEEMLIAGEVVAATGMTIDNPIIKPLIPDAREAGFAALKATGYYPINHTLVVRDELLAAQPGLAKELFMLFAEAKKPYIERLKNKQIAQPSAADQTYARVMEITGADPLPYGIEPNRKMLEMVIRLAGEQGIIKQPFTVEELFAAGTHDLVG